MEHNLLEMVVPRVKSFVSGLKIKLHTIGGLSLCGLKVGTINYVLHGLGISERF